MTPAVPRRAVWIALLFVGLLLPPPPAEARSVGTVPYPIADVWPSAVRFLRIDRNCVIREKDEAAGYILFDYPEGQKLHNSPLQWVSRSASARIYSPRPIAFGLWGACTRGQTPASKIN